MDISHDEFLSTYFEKACKIADITIHSIIRTNGPIDSSIDIESVKMEGALAGLERTFESFDAQHKSKAKVTTLLNTIVHNCVLTELGKASTEARRAGLISPKPKKKEKKDEAVHIINSVKQRGNVAGPVEAHQYIESEGWQERKETVLKLIGNHMKRLPLNDQVILTYWAEDEKTYVEKSLEELGLENTPSNANWIYGRKNKALKALKAMMGGQKPEYREIYLSKTINYRHTASKLAEKLYHSS